MLQAANIVATMDKAALEAKEAVAKLAKDSPLPEPQALNDLAVAQAELADFLALQLTQARPSYSLELLQQYWLFTHWRYRTSLALSGEP